MILSVGTDLVDVRRMQQAHARHGARFLARVFTPPEIIDIRAHRTPEAAMAKRFAAKEAYAKARGTGFRSGFTLRDIGVVHDALGRPGFALSSQEA